MPKNVSDKCWAGRGTSRCLSGSVIICVDCLQSQPCVRDTCDLPSLQQALTALCVDCMPGHELRPRTKPKWRQLTLRTAMAAFSVS
jgi:hypothetical protein